MSYTPQVLDSELLAEFCIEASGAEGDEAEQAWKDIALAIVEWLETEDDVIIDGLNLDEAINNNSTVGESAAHGVDKTNPHNVSKTQVGLGNVENIKNNYEGTRAPTATDDESAGYSVGSVWVDIVSKSVFTCVDPTTSAAIWVNESESGSVSGEIILLTNELDLTSTGNTTVNAIPTNSTFYINEVGIILSTFSGTLTTQPTISIGVQTTDTIRWVNNITTTALDTLRKREVTNVSADSSSEAGVTGILQGTVNTAATGTTLVMNGKFYFKGILVEDE